MCAKLFSGLLSASNGSSGALLETLNIGQTATLFDYFVVLLAHSVKAGE